MLAQLLAFALVAQPARGGDKVAYENIAFRLPAGWTQAEQGQGAFLKPRDLAQGQSFVIAIAHEGDKPAGTLEQGLEQSWLEFSGDGSKVIRRSPATEISTAGGARGLSSSGILETRGTRILLTVVVFKPKDRYRVVATLANGAAANDKYRAAFDDLLESLELGRGAPAVASAVSPGYELLLTFASGLSASPGGGTTYGSSAYVYCLFADGSWLSTAPGRGLNGFDLAAEQRKRPADFGTWQRSNGVLTLRTPGRLETVYPQADGSYLRKDKEAREGTCFRIPPSTGLRFAGRYLKEGQGDGPATASITFHADGTFEDRGVARMIVPDEIGVSYRDISQVLGPGSGTYEIVSNTLTLSYADGRRKPMLFILTPALAGAKDPVALYLGKVWFKRS
jgi:hypothetical protein